MEPCTTWQCFNSFALWISSLGTVLISAVSLYVSYRAYSYARNRDVPVISTKITAGIIPTSPQALQFIGVEVVNTGHRKVIVSGYSWLFKDFRGPGKQIVSHVAVNQHTALSSKLPCELDEGQKSLFFNPFDMFSTTAGFFDGSYFNVWYRVRSLRLMVSCTTINETINLEKGIRKVIMSQYKAQRKTQKVKTQDTTA